MGLSSLKWHEIVKRVFNVIAKGRTKIEEYIKVRD
jgi:hypothetical protein